MTKPPVRTHEALVAWQLCHRLRSLVLRYTRSGPAARDFDFRRQLRRSARSACYNTSEGFYRYHHGEFGYLLNIARGSLGEALDQIEDGGESEYFTREQQTEMRRLCIRAMKANIALRKSWERKAPEHPAAPLQHACSTLQHPCRTLQHPCRTLQHPCSTSQHP